MKKALLSTVAALLILFYFALRPGVEKTRNRVLTAPPYSASQAAQTLHSSLIIVDLHADSLLWDRDLLNRANRGHLDIPRLIEGNVGIQVFDAITKIPRDLNMNRNDDRSDSITALAMMEGWPPNTWNSLKQRALYQANRLTGMAGRSDGRFVVIKTVSDLDAYLKRREQDREITAGIIGLEGAHALEGKLVNLDAFYEAGFRIISPTHFFDTEMGGSSSGVHKGGLTPLGRELVRRLEAKHILLDLSHASPATIEDATAIATKPVIVSHTGVKGTCNNVRNLSDEEIRAIAKTGGVIGIGYWDTAVCGNDGDAIARAVRYAANVAGVEHVGIGSDFDGSTTVPFDSSGLVKLTEALLRQGFSESEVRMIMGGNAVRVFRQTLPQ